MKVQKVIKDETRRIALGVCALTLIMAGVYLALGMLTLEVALGALLGMTVAIGNFFLMALGVQKAVEQMNGVTLPPEEAEDAEKETDQEEKTGVKKQELPQQKAARRVVQWSYFLRMVLLAGAAIVAVLVPVIDAIAAVIPLFFPRLTITLQQMRQKKDKESERK